MFCCPRSNYEGGGGMISGVAIALKALDPRIKVIGAEPLNASDAAAVSGVI